MWPLVLALGCPKSSRTSGDAEPPVAPWTSHPLLDTAFWVWQFGAGFSTFGGALRVLPKEMEAAWHSFIPNFAKPD